MSEMKHTPKCATCQNIGVAYWDNGFTISHHCKKEAVRRAETMPRGADLFAHFRAFFDADADQKACRHYEERPICSEEVQKLLSSMGEGRAEFRCWSDESLLASKLEGKFLKQDWHSQAPYGYRVFRLLPVGKVERDRALSKAAPKGEESNHG